MTDAKIVITSSWRFIHDFSALKQMWIHREMPGEIYSILTTEYSNKSRGEEIALWMHGKDIRFVILDDEYDFDKTQQDYVIITNSIRGLSISIKDAKKAICT